MKTIELRKWSYARGEFIRAEVEGAQEQMKINVIGLGYIGLPTALIMAANGQSVVGTDRDPDRVRLLNQSQMPFAEKQMRQMFDEAVRNNIEFSEQCVPADIYIVAVPTPYDKVSKKVNIDFIADAVKSALHACNDGSIVVIESTIPPGTIEIIAKNIIEPYSAQTGKGIFMAHAPERIIPGSMISELGNNARVIGVEKAFVGGILKKVYGSFCRSEIIITDIRTAEMVKVVENTYRDVNIAFANELVRICREGSMNVYDIIKIANMHPRVNILQPGPGVGGHCISVDPWFLVGDYPGLVNIILAARKINDAMPEYVLQRVSEIMREHRIGSEKVGFYGLTYKENIDDTRESPTLQLLDKIKLHLGTPPKVFDPLIDKKVADNQYCDFDEFIEDIDLLVIMVAHDHIARVKEKIKDKVVLDTRNVLGIHENIKVHRL
jgi:UDP-N-acetyl-D-mannosaminuronic acid dehydrogenase